MKLIFLGFTLVTGFTLFVFIFSRMIKFANFLLDKQIKKEQARLESGQKKSEDHKNGNTLGAFSEDI
jgi:hypothetical protein